MVSHRDLFDGVLAKGVAVEYVLTEEDGAPCATAERLEFEEEARVVAR